MYFLKKTNVVFTYVLAFAFTSCKKSGDSGKCIDELKKTIICVLPNTTLFVDVMVKRIVMPVKQGAMV